VLFGFDVVNGLETTTAVGAEVALELPALLEAVTVTASVYPTSPLPIR
jgi:hypothetical protein